MFQRDQHNRILTVLAALDGHLFQRADYALDGGAALTLRFEEYREARDIKILCGTQQGERILRDIEWHEGLAGWFRPGAMPPVSRDLTCGMHGMKATLHVAGSDVTLRIVPERKFALSAHMNRQLGLPVLDDTPQYASLLLDNTMRWDDDATKSRDIIDLAIMISRLGPVPVDAWREARSAYGEQVTAALRSATGRVQNPRWLEACLKGLGMSSSSGDEINDALNCQIAEMGILYQ